MTFTVRWATIYPNCCFSDPLPSSAPIIPYWPLLPKWTIEKDQLSTKVTQKFKLNKEEYSNSIKLWNVFSFFHSWWSFQRAPTSPAEIWISWDQKIIEIVNRKKRRLKPMQSILFFFSSLSFLLISYCIYYLLIKTCVHCLKDRVRAEQWYLNIKIVD